MSTYVSPMEAIVAQEQHTGHTITQEDADIVMAANQQLNDGVAVTNAPEDVVTTLNAYRTGESIPTASADWFMSAGKVMLFGFAGIVAVELLIKFI
jgi:hypothetical protein